MIKDIHLKGSHYEIGLQMGEVLKTTGGFPPKFPEEVLSKSPHYEEQIRIHAPDLLDEFHGIADSLGIDHRIPLTLEATPFRFQFTSCFVMAVSGEFTSSGKPVLARNHEYLERDSQNLRVCFTYPDGKLASQGFTFHWPLVSRYGGMNEAGLALSSASASFKTAGPGIMLNIATRWILDNCRSTGEAVAYLEKMPKVWGETYVLIDKDNVIAKVESHSQKTTVTYAESGCDFNSLLFDSPQMQSVQDQWRYDDCKEFTAARRAFIKGWFPRYKGRITDELLIDVLKDHENKMCVHGKEGLEICWSYLLFPADNRALVCQGRPCKNEFIAMTGPKISSC